jgi:hypothetical protein
VFVTSMLFPAAKVFDRLYSPYQAMMTLQCCVAPDSCAIGPEYPNHHSNPEYRRHGCNHAIFQCHPR